MSDENSISCYRGSDGLLHMVSNLPADKQSPPIPPTAENQAIIDVLAAAFGSGRGHE